MSPGCSAWRYPQQPVSIAERTDQDVGALTQGMFHKVLVQGCET